jgi:hypothetical protein
MGPYIQVATFCEDVTRDEVTKNLTVSRFVTGANLGMIGGPKKMPPLSIAPFPLVVTMWAGELVGSYRLRIVPEDPQGRTLEAAYETEVEFTDESLSGVDLILRLPTLVSEEGIYFFGVVISALDGSDERTIARIPLKVQYSRVATSPRVVTDRPAETILRHPA